MARNRRQQTAGFRLGPVLLAVALCVILAGSGVGYVWQKGQIDLLGRELKQREQRLADLRLQNERLRRQLATLRSPRFLEQRVRELNLGLVPVRPTQILELPEPTGQRSEGPEPGRLVAIRPAAG
mgnify:CR=1 FL=1